MHARILTTVLMAAALSLPAGAQDFLPSSLPGWSAGPAARRAAEAGLERLSYDWAPIFREYGAVSVESRSYERNGSKLAVTVHQMRDPTGAYGLFTFMRTEDLEGGKLGELSALSDTRALVAVGNLLLSVHGTNLTRLVGDLNGLVASLYPKARLGPLPTVGDYLPAKEQIPGSRRYAAGPVTLAHLWPLADGDWIGFSDGAEVEWARYRTSNGEVTLIVASYPTPQVAGQRILQIEKTLKDAPGSAGANSVAVRSVSLIAIATGAPSRAAAEALLKRIRYASEVTWNEPGYSATDPTMPEIILGAIYGTGSIFLFAFLSGISFGLLRVLVKQYLPGRIFDRPGSVEIIQLGLTSKPIEAKDFY
jgi:hypothetical protein